jgi:hypothetical protein
VWQGLVVIGSGVGIIGLADNLLRPMLVGRDTGIPDWIILVSTLGGIAVLGFSGIVIGPLIAGLFLASWSILREMRETDTHNHLEAEAAASAQSAPPSSAPRSRAGRPHRRLTGMVGGSCGRSAWTMFVSSPCRSA